MYRNSLRDLFNKLYSKLKSIDHLTSLAPGNMIELIVLIWVFNYLFGLQLAQGIESGLDYSINRYFGHQLGVFASCIVRTQVTLV